ncbi:lysine-specific demethylase JMJ30 isoform X3 [Carya illinoinensis]|uniref:lysine-specific demethylase JMJ30 isoform X3 n=1 Tax=Carya illinoinensis TaxID=32201 RepID=UPI001C71D23C|nr:lysine-specific demethylase JMJ30 isoform X3 [Carya illinoinensis]
MSSSTAFTESSDHFETPTMDLEAPTLLQDITEQGGYAYVSMATLAAAGDSRAAEAAREMAWEQLHSGPWHSVLPVWRDAYSMACLHVARLHFSKGELSESLRVLDMGLIMGGMLLRKDLDSAVDKVSAKARDAGAVSEQLAKRKLVRQDGLRDAEVSDSMAHWPARTKWNDMDYLRRVAGDRTVPVEVGKNYLCPEWKQELITFSQFLARIEANDFSSDAPTYLAQHPLFDQISELRNDICIPDYCFAGGGELRSLNAWFGPAGTVTPLHHDPHHNILAQVVGRKYVRLYHASLSEELYPYTETMLKNSSQVDLDNIDEIRFPKVHDLGFEDCILEEGGGLSTSWMLDMKGSGSIFWSRRRVTCVLRRITWSKGLLLFYH